MKTNSPSADRQDFLDDLEAAEFTLGMLVQHHIQFLDVEDFHDIAVLRNSFQDMIKKEKKRAERQNAKK